MPLLLLLAACGCPDFDEIELVDHTADGLEAGEVERMWEVIDWFEDSTGLDGVCVDDVHVHDDFRLPWTDVGGLLDTDGNKIHIDRHAGWFTLAHELCHAVDHKLGRPSFDRPDLFDPDSIEDRWLYPTRQARISEAFANACEKAWLDRQIHEAIGEHCGEPDPDPVIEFLLDEVFVAYPLVPETVRFDDLPGPVPRSLAAIVGPDWLGDAAGSDHTIGLLLWPRGRHPPSGTHPQDLTIVHVDPWTLAERSRVTLGLGDVVHVELIHGTDFVTLVTYGNDYAGRAFRIAPDGEVTRVVLPDAPIPWFDDGFDDGERIQLVGMLGDDRTGEPGVVEIDLAAGTVDPRPAWVLDHGIARFSQLYPSPDGPLFWVDTAEGERRWLSLRTRAEAPGPHHSDLVAVTADGGAWLRPYRYLDARGDYVAGWGRLDATGEVLTLPASICTADSRVVERRLQVGGSAWVLEVDPNAWDAPRLQLLPL